jgi:L-threonylcarbamoyladenylate synthase
VDLILDGGPSRVGIESTVVDLTSAVPTILRPGAITAEQISELIGRVESRVGVVSASEAASSPGQQAVHYSPMTATFRLDEEDLDCVRRFLRERVGRRKIFLIIPGTELGRAVSESLMSDEIVAMPSTPREYGPSLYASLHRADEAGVEAIWVQKPPDGPEWNAIVDRLMRATRPAGESLGESGSI